MRIRLDCFVSVWICCKSGSQSTVQLLTSTKQSKRVVATVSATPILRLSGREGDNIYGDSYPDPLIKRLNRGTFDVSCWIALGFSNLESVGHNISALSDCISLISSLFGWGGTQAAHMMRAKLISFKNRFNCALTRRQARSVVANEVSYSPTLNSKTSQILKLSQIV